MHSLVLAQLLHTMLLLLLNRYSNPADFFMTLINTDFHETDLNKAVVLTSHTSVKRKRSIADSANDFPKSYMYVPHYEHGPQYPCTLCLSVLRHYSNCLIKATILRESSDV